MELRQRTRGFGGRVVAFAIVFRLLTGGLPGRVVSWLKGPEAAAWMIFLETGRDVRFSVSSREPHSLESPPPQLALSLLPVFSGQEAEAVALKDSGKFSPELEKLLEQPLDWNLKGEEPTVLILHSHATESYTPSGESYRESAPYRTLDEDYNMVSVGARVAELLEAGGITVIHSHTLHDHPSYDGAYASSRQEVSELLARYPTIRLVLDLHRDASGGDGGQLRTAVRLSQGTAARLMLVMGGSHDRWEDNLSLAVKLQLQLEAEAPGITRPIDLRTGRFNQDLCPGALLVEVGAAGNTRAEALAAAEVLARAILSLAEGTRKV